MLFWSQMAKEQEEAKDPTTSWCTGAIIAMATGIWWPRSHQYFANDRSLRSFFRALHSRATARI